ncbi:unnamed protein product, partial [Meganyctiphanes norvegica]
MSHAATVKLHSSAIDKSECSICNNTFDGAARRPRALPCGHGFCTQCLEAYIQTGRKTCPTCRVEHGASSATDLPVCFILEELLHKASITASQKHEPESVHEEDIAEMCPKHKGIPLYFYCKTQLVKVCHSCTVLDHPPSSCKLISLDDQIKEKKQIQIETVHNHKQALINAKRDLKSLYQRNIVYLTEQKNTKQDLEKEVSLLLSKIEQINQEILVKEKSQEQIDNAIQSCEEKEKSFEYMENRLKSATCCHDIDNVGRMTTAVIIQSQKWEETLRKKLNMDKDVYAQVLGNGIRRTSKVFIEGSKMFIPNLSKDVQPTSSARLIQEAELGLTSATTTVFMDLSAQGQCLGRIFIKVKGDRPHGQQFIMLILGSNGPTFKGAPFTYKDRKNIGMREYITESGTKSTKSLLTTLVVEHPQKPLRGMLFSKWSQSGSFDIFTDIVRTWQFHGHFGDIISGIEVVDRAASSEFNITDVIISECGIIIE